MEIQTRHNGKDLVYFLHENQLCTGGIVSVTIKKGNCTYQEDYEIKHPGNHAHITLPYTKVFATREELTQDLLTTIK